MTMPYAPRTHRLFFVASCALLLGIAPGCGGGDSATPGGNNNGNANNANGDNANGDNANNGDNGNGDNGENNNGNGENNNGNGNNGNNGGGTGSCDDPRSLSGALPASVGGETRGADASVTSRCSRRESMSPVQLWRFVAPAQGRYRFDTNGSNFDTVLSLREPACDGEELRCNDDESRENRQSVIVADLLADQAVLVAVSGFETTDFGAVSLNVARAEAFCEDGDDDDDDGMADCADSDCAGAPNCQGVACPAGAFDAALPGEEGGRTVEDAPGYLGLASCGDGGGRSPEMTFSFTAPKDGPYRISTAGSSFDTLLYVRESNCTGRELGCNDDQTGGGEGGHSLLTVELESETPVVIVVDGFGGATGEIALHIEAVEIACDNGDDDDGDGKVDCADDDCLSVECATGGAWPAEWVGLEEQMLIEVNKRRAEGATCDQDVFGPAPALEMNPKLRLAARLHSRDMGEQDYFEHEGLDGRSATQRMRDAGFTGELPTGENLSAGRPTAEASVEGLMNSPGHCRNIMNPRYRVVGMGYYYAPAANFRHYWTQNFGGSHGE